MTRTSAIIAGAAVVAVALIGGFACSRESATPAVAATTPVPGAVAYNNETTPVADVPCYANPLTVRTISAQPAEQQPAPQYSDQLQQYAGQQVNGQQVVNGQYSSSGQYSTGYATAQYGAAPGPQYYAAPAPAPAPQYVYRTAPRTRVIVKRRPWKKSLAIVGGSAGVGAAIGAIAGGGPGAGIGAIAGGSAGFIYDRLTHKKREVVQY